MKLEIPIQITAADSIKRTIAGRIVSFNETANASTGKVMFQDGSLTPAPVKLNLEHDGTRPIGKSMSMDFSTDKTAIDGVFKIATTTAGSPSNAELATAYLTVPGGFRLILPFSIASPK